MVAAPTCVYTEAATGSGTTFPNPPATTLNANTSAASLTGTQSLQVTSTTNFPASGKLAITTLGFDSALVSYNGTDATHFLNCKLEEAAANDTLSSSTNVCKLRVGDPGDTLVIGQGGTSGGTGTTTAPTGIGTMTSDATSGSVSASNGRSDVWRRILTASDFSSASKQLSTVTVDSSKYTNHRWQAVIERHAYGFNPNAIVHQAIVDNSNDATARTLTDPPKAGFQVLISGFAASTTLGTVSWSGGTGRTFFDDGSTVNYAGDHSSHFGLNNSSQRRTYADFNEFADTDTVSSVLESTGWANTTHRTLIVTYIVSTAPIFGTAATEHDTPQAGSVTAEQIVTGSQAAEHDHPQGSLGGPADVNGTAAAEHDVPAAGAALVGEEVIGAQASEHDTARAGGFVFETWTQHLEPIGAGHYRLTTLTLRAKKLNVSDAGEVQISLLEGASLAAGPSAWTALTDSFADTTLDVSGYAPADGTNLYIRYTFRRAIDGTLEPAVSWIGLGWEAWAVETEAPQTGTVTTFGYGTASTELDVPQAGSIAVGTAVAGSQALESDVPQAGVGVSGGTVFSGNGAVEHDEPQAGMPVQGQGIGGQAHELDVPQHGLTFQVVEQAGAWGVALHTRWEARIAMPEQVLTSSEEWEVEVMFKVGREPSDPTAIYVPYLSWQPTRYADEPGNNFTGADAADWVPANWQTINGRYFLIAKPPAIAQPARRHVFVGLAGNGEAVVLHAGSRKVA